METSSWGVVRGFRLVFILHLIQVVVGYLSSFLTPDLPVVLFGFFGFIQFIYIIPTILYFRRKGESKIVLGLVIGSALTFAIGLASAWAFVDFIRGYLLASPPPSLA